MVNSIHDSNTLSCHRLETEIRPCFQDRNVLDEDRPSHPRPGQYSCFRESSLSLAMLFHIEAMRTLDIDSSFQWSFFFIKCDEELSFSTIFTPASQQLLQFSFTLLQQVSLQLCVCVGISNMNLRSNFHCFQVCVCIKFP